MWLVWIIAFVILAVLGYYYFVSSSGEQDSDSDEDDDTFQDWLDSAIDEVADVPQSHRIRSSSSVSQLVLLSKKICPFS